jgi:hypothetical protein
MPRAILQPQQAELFPSDPALTNEHARAFFLRLRYTDARLGDPKILSSVEALAPSRRLTTPMPLQKTLAEGSAQ